MWVSGPLLAGITTVDYILGIALSDTLTIHSCVVTSSKYYGYPRYRVVLVCTFVCCLVFRDNSSGLSQRSRK